MAKARIPQLRQKKGRAVVIVPTATGRRKEIALGAWQSKEAQTAYTEVLKTLAIKEGRWPDHAPTTPNAIRTVSELALAFVQQRLPQYRTESPEPRCYRQIIVPALVAKFGSLPAAVRRACERAGIKFTPYSLRPGRKMDLCRRYGADAARAVLGQKSIDATAHYGAIDQAHAAQVMREVG